MSKPTRIGFAGAALLVCVATIGAFTQKYWRPASGGDPDSGAREAARFIVTMMRENHIFGEPIAFPAVSKACIAPEGLQEVRDAVKALLAGAATSVRSKMLCIPNVRIAGDETFAWEDPAACDALGAALVALAADDKALRTLAARRPRLVNHQGRIETGTVDFSEALTLATSRFDFARMSYACEPGSAQIRITVPQLR